MKKVLSILFISLIIFSCSSKDNERSKIEQEKERLRIENQAREELIQEEIQKREQLIQDEKTKYLNAEIETQVLRLEDAFQNFNLAKTDIEKLERLAMLEGIYNRILKTDILFFWLDSTPKWNFKELKIFEIEYNLKKESEDFAKAKLYLDAKKMDANAIIINSSISDSEKGKLRGSIIKADILE